MKFTIIIPCYNEEKYILEVLKKIQIQKKRYDIQIIVVDDCSNDKSNTILKNNQILYDKLIIFDLIPEKILINDNCWIGAKSIIYPGVSLNKNSIIKMNSSVTKNHP